MTSTIENLKRKDPVKGILASRVQEDLGSRGLLTMIENELREQITDSADVVIEHQDLSALETFLVVRGLKGGPRYFLVRISEQM